MCVYSMVLDHYWDKWHGPYYVPTPAVPEPPSPSQPPVHPEGVPNLSPEEIMEFRRLLERAKEYDRKNNQPECELEEKKDRLRKLAELIGVDISFP